MKRSPLSENETYKILETRIPFAHVKDGFVFLCDFYGVHLIFQDESCTSKVSVFRQED